MAPRHLLNHVDQSQDDDLFNLLENVSVRNASASKELLKLVQSPLDFGLPMHVVFIDGTVCEVHEHVRDVLAFQRVFAAAETDNSLFVNVYRQWRDRSHQHVDSEVPFVTIYQEWIGYVPLNDAALLESTVAKLADVVD